MELDALIVVKFIAGTLNQVCTNALNVESVLVTPATQFFTGLRFLYLIG
jgi:hypothetical protein